MVTGLPRGRAPRGRPRLRTDRREVERTLTGRLRGAAPGRARVQGAACESHPTPGARAGGGCRRTCHPPFTDRSAWRRRSDRDAHREATGVERAVAEHEGRARRPPAGRPRRGGGVEDVVGRRAPGPAPSAARRCRGTAPARSARRAARPSAVRLVVVSGAPASSANADSGWASTTASVSPGSMAASTSAILARRLKAWMEMPLPSMARLRRSASAWSADAEHRSRWCREHRRAPRPEPGAGEVVARPPAGVGQADRHVEADGDELAGAHPLEDLPDVGDHLDRQQRRRAGHRRRGHDPARPAAVDPGDERVGGGDGSAAPGGGGHGATGR